jgi:hypothetical protein
MIAAILSICLQADPTQCAVQHFRIEAKACHLGPYRAEAPAGGEWHAVIVGVKCFGQAAPERRHS